MKNILIIGATSAIAKDVARRYAAAGARLHLLARDAQQLEELAADLRIRGAAQVTHAAFDATDSSAHATLVARAREQLGSIDVALLAHGSLGDQRACEADYSTTLHELQVNFLSVVSLCTPLANLLQEQKGGCLAVIGSVAGDRGRQSNYVYGTAKGGVAVFLSGLRQRLAKHGVQVLTIKPGFVDTPMTAAFPKGPLWASAATVGGGIVRAIEKGSDIAYLPARWWLIMAIIKSIPERLFKTLKL